MTATLPAVGARIRVTRTHETGAICVAEGVHDYNYVHFNDQYLRLDGHFNVLIGKGNGWSTAIEVLEAAPRSAIEEPPVDALVGNDGSGPRELFVRNPATGAPELGPGEYYDLLRRVRMDWAGVLKRVSAPVRWVPAPFLAEMIEALREAAPAWHDKECGDYDGTPSYYKCTRTECVEWRALLAKVTGEVAA